MGTIEFIATVFVLKLLIYTLNYEPELTGVGKYSAELAHWLADRGHQVTVVTALPYYPEWKLHAGYRTGYFGACQRSSREGLRVYRSWLWVPSKPNGRNRVVHLLSFALMSVPLLLRAFVARPNLVFVVMPTLVAAPAAAGLAFLFGARRWLHVHDFEIDAALKLQVLDLGPSRHGSALTRAAFAVERRLLAVFERVSTISDGMLARLRNKGVTDQRSLKFPNWVDLSALKAPIGANPVRRELGLDPADILVMYAGNMGEKQGLDIVIDAARLLNGLPRLHFLMVGEGSARAALQLNAANLSNITWWPLQTKERLSNLLHAADIHVLPQRAGAADLVMPSKLGPMLASGRLVIGTADAGTELGDTLEAVGVRVPPGDATLLAASLLAWSEPCAPRAARGTAGRSFVETTLERDTVLGAFEQECLALVDSPRH